jgi:ankyrin repeat protein
MRLTAVMFLCSLAAIAGCDRGDRRASAPLSASQIFADPRQLRLAEAVVSGSKEAVREELRLGADIDAPGHAGIRMLMWAMLAGSIEGFEALLDNDANVMARHYDPDSMRPGQKTNTVAEHVCTFADKRYLDSMLAHGFDPNRVVDQVAGETMLFHAVTRHDLQAASRLVEAGANVNHRNTYSRTPLALAVSIGDFRMAMLLYSRGGDPLVKDQAGFDVIDTLKRYGTRGFSPEQRPYFDEFVSSLEQDELMTQDDIIEADKPRSADDQSGLPGISVIEHAPSSETGKAILQMERRRRDAHEHYRTR